VEGNDDGLEENDVFVSERDCKATDNTGENIQEFGSSVKFVGSVNKGEKALVNSFSNHFSSWDKFGIKFMQNVLKVVTLDRFFGVEELKELLDELWRHVDL
jgi:hypothetical protein